MRCMPSVEMFTVAVDTGTMVANASAREKKPTLRMDGTTALHHCVGGWGKDAKKKSQQLRSGIEPDVGVEPTSLRWSV